MQLTVEHHYFERTQFLGNIILHSMDFTNFDIMH